MYGLHFSDTIAGRVFSQTPTPLGLAIPIYSATAIGGAGVCSLPIWNPPGSGVLVELIEINIERASGTSDFGAIGIMAGYVTAIGTATGCSALASTTPVNCYLGSQSGSRVVSNNGAGTVTVTAGTTGAPVQGTAGAGWVRTLFCFNLEADTGTAHANSICEKDMKGTFVIPPGVLIYLAATKASVALEASSIVWKEIPINSSVA